MTQTQVTKSKLSVFPKFKSHKKYFVDNFVVKKVEDDVFNLFILSGQQQPRSDRINWNVNTCRGFQLCQARNHKQMAAVFSTCIVKSRSQCW